MPLLVLRRTDVAETRVSALPIVPAFDVLEDGAAGVVERDEGALGRKFVFERGEEAFEDGIVPAIAFAASAARDAVRRQAGLKRAAGEWTPAIRVLQQIAGGRTADQRHVERVQHERVRQRRAHGASRSRDARPCSLCPWNTSHLKMRRNEVSMTSGRLHCYLMVGKCANAVVSAGAL